MTKLAVDVALLPPEDIMDICIGLNRKKGSDAFSGLNKKDNLPHITLAMGVIDEKDLPKIKNKLEEISKRVAPPNLEITGSDYIITPENKKSYHFSIKLTKELANLHGVIMKELLSIFSYDVELDMFYKDKNKSINEVSTFWVKNYGKKHTDPKNYHPHISLKCRNAEFDKFPIKFFTSKLALCHLGNYRTCRKVLTTIILKR